MSWFATGYEKVHEVSKRIEEALNQEYLPTLSMKDGEEAQVTFLTEKPLTFYEHFLKGMKRSFTCCQDATCPLCAMGNKPSFKGAYLVIDHREEEWKDNDGVSKKRKDTLKVLKLGIRALKVIDKKNTKKGLLAFDWIISRTGSGNDTQYDFEDCTRSPLPVIEKMPNLVEVLKPKSREYLLQQLAQGGQGQPASNPINVENEDDGVINFGS